MMDKNIITATRVKQNNQEFLLGVFPIKRIFTFTKHTQRVIDHYNDNNQPIYNNQVQRKIDQSRAEKIAYFLLDDPDAIFPTNIVISVPNAIIHSIEDVNDLTYVTIDEKVFHEINKEEGDVYMTIIDGQHRVRGIEIAINKLKTEIKDLKNVLNNSKNDKLESRYNRRMTQLNNLLNINLVVTFFIDPTLEFQAMIFSTINRTQKTVPQSLVSSLFGLTENDTPQKTGLEIVLALNAFQKSPFYNRIRLHGGKYDRNQSPPLTQAGMVKSIVDLISTNQKDLERDRFRERKELIVNLSSDLPFRKYYAENRDTFITDIMYSYFTAVKNTFIVDGIHFWDFQENTRPQNVLHTTVGYNALMKLLVEILKIETQDKTRDEVETYEKYLSKCKSIKFGDQQRYPFTSVTKSILFYDMSLKIWPPNDESDERIVRRDEALKKR